MMTQETAHHPLQSSSEGTVILEHLHCLAASNRVTCGRSTVTNERAKIQYPVTVKDITGHEGDYTLDNVGFQLHQHESKTLCIADGYNDESKIRSDYFPECEQLLKDM